MKKDLLIISDNLTLQHPDYHITHNTYKHAFTHPPDLIIIDSLELCKKIKRTPLLRHIPLILLGPPTDESNILLAFDLGADDYLFTPVSLPILFSRIKVLLKQSTPKHKRIPFGPFHLDTKQQQLRKNQDPIDLTTSEFTILKKLLTHQGKTLSRRDLLSNTPHLTTRNIDVHIAALRKKLGKDYIKTIRGIGYQLTSS